MKQQLSKICAQGISVVLHPLFMPTYSIVSILVYLQAAWQYTAIVSACCFLMTCLCPLFEIWRRVRLGKLKSIELSDRKERTVPYLISVLCLVIWCALADAFELPWTIVGIYVACAALLLVVTLINLKWKISIHLTSFGAYAGMMAVLTRKAECLWLFPVLLFVALLLMYARIRLKTHTPLQVVAGFLLGLTASSVAMYFLMPN